MIKWLELEAFTIEEKATPLFFQHVMMNKRFPALLQDKVNSGETLQFFRAFRLS